jgi:hypothetical protein
MITNDDTLVIHFDQFSDITMGTHGFIVRITGEVDRLKTVFFHIRIDTVGHSLYGSITFIFYIEKGVNLLFLIHIFVNVLFGFKILKQRFGIL